MDMFVLNTSIGNGLKQFHKISSFMFNFMECHVIETGPFTSTVSFYESFLVAFSARLSTHVDTVPVPEKSKHDQR